MAIHIKTDMQSTLVNEETHPVFFNGGGDKGMTLKGMQSLVGGNIEILTMNPPVVIGDRTYTRLGINEEGKFSGLKFNQVATQIAKTNCKVAVDDIIVGDAILFEDQELN